MSTRSRLLRNHATSALPASIRPGSAVHAFHQRLPGYAPTPLRDVPELATAAGLARVLVKDESSRLGLPAFKILGASWATYRVVCKRLGGEPSWDTVDDLAGIVAERLGPLTLVAATDGNHGRAVAHVAKLLGLSSRILVPSGTADARIEGIASEGAEVVEVPGTYDDAVAVSASMAGERTLVVSDTSWPGYEDPPRWVIEGYATIFSEIDAQLAGPPDEEDDRGEGDPGGRGGDPRGEDPRGGDPRGEDPRGGDPRGGDPRGEDPRGEDPRGEDAAAGDPAAVGGARDGEGSGDRPRVLVGPAGIEVPAAAVVDVVVVPLGVGALGAAAAASLRAGRVPGDGPMLIGVEPDSAACVAAAVEAGHLVEVPGPHDSIMAGLNCGLASMLALPTLTASFDAFVAVDDDRCREAIRALAAAGMDVGETGAAALAGLTAVVEEHRDELPIPSEATVLLLATEGVTDPVNFEEIVGRPPR